MATDGVIAIGFGLYSWFYPHETFGTKILTPEENSSVFLEILSGLSLFYILIGLTCLTGIKLTFPGNTWVGLLKIVSHLLEGILKIFDIGEEWLIGNPYPDIIIHSVLISWYILAICFTYRKTKKRQLKRLKKN